MIPLFSWCQITKMVSFVVLSAMKNISSILTNNDKNWEQCLILCKHMWILFGRMESLYIKRTTLVPLKASKSASSKKLVKSYYSHYLILKSDLAPSEFAMKNRANFLLNRSILTHTNWRVTQCVHVSVSITSISARTTWSLMIYQQPTSFQA